MSEETKSHWYEPMREIQSLGQTTAKATSLGGLAEKRAIHKGQYFTPDAVAALMWQQGMPALEAVRKEGQRIKVLDNSIGSGRLIQFARPDRHAIFGADVDERCIDALGPALKAAEFDFDVRCAGMERLYASGMDLALINPPFSVGLSSPTMIAYPCTSFGRFGPGTSAMSEAYALHQALDAAQVVVALLPRTYADEVIADRALSKRLCRVIHLPEQAFATENAQVHTSILVFGHTPALRRDVVMWTGQPIEPVEIKLGELAPRVAMRFRVEGVQDDAPSITMPVTHDRRVRVVRHGRQIRLRFGCGWMQARVMNAIYREKAPNADGNAYHRYPKGVRFVGQGPLDVQNLLATNDPVQMFHRKIVDVIEGEGGVAVVDPGLVPYLRKQHRRLARQRIPMARWAFLQSGQSTHALPDQGKFQVRAREKQLLNPTAWGSPIMQPGDVLDATVLTTDAGARYELAWKGAKVVLTAEAVTKKYEVIAEAKSGWQKVEPGRLGLFPDIETSLRKRMQARGIDRWLWDGFQQDDVIEGLIGRTGVAYGWLMGLGKSRCGSALCLMSQGKHNALITEAHLVYEMARELRKIGIPEDEWQIIEEPRHVQCLKRFNLISYTRLRMAVDPARPKHTYAKALRRRFHTVVLDEAHAIAHTETQQTRALWTLSPRVRFAMSGTLIGNYPRDLLPVLQWTAGDCTPLQPYGEGALNRPANVESMAFVPRGVDAFRDRFVSTAWVTNEFAEDMQSGAKREIPVIADAPGFRDWLAPMVKRRVRQEPEVARYIKVKDPEVFTHQVEFDDLHLAHYLAVAEEFASWYRNAKRDADLKGTQLNLMLILRRIQEVQFACSYPQGGRDGPSVYGGGLTSKQRWIVRRFDELVKQGRRILLFAQSPETIELLARHLREMGHDIVALHGKIPPKKRMAEIEARFRHGQAHLLLTYKANKTGLNLPEGNHVLLYEHDWTPKTEDQAIGRAVRPEQREDVIAEHVEIVGSIDEYMAQMCSGKRMAAAAGLDFGEQDDREFLHLDSILGRFIRDLEERRGLTRKELKEVRNAA